MRDNLEAPAVPALHSYVSSSLCCIVRITRFRLDVKTVERTLGIVIKINVDNNTATVQLTTGMSMTCLKLI